MSQQMSAARRRTVAPDGYRAAQMLLYVLSVALVVLTSFYAYA